LYFILYNSILKKEIISAAAAVIIGLVIIGPNYSYFTQHYRTDWRDDMPNAMFLKVYPGTLRPYTIEKVNSPWPGIIKLL
jgi:hypothetical protein